MRELGIEGRVVLELERLLDDPRLLKLALRGVELPELHVDAEQVQVGEVARLVPGGLLRHLQPGDRLVELALLDEIRADVVVGIPEAGIDPDGDLALLDGLVVAALEGVGPAEVGVRLGGRVDLDRRLVETDRLPQIAGPLFLVGLLDDPQRPLQPDLGLDHVATPSGVHFHIS